MAENSSGEHDLFERIGEKVNRERIRQLLTEYYERFPDEIHTSGSKPELVEHLRDATNAGRIPRDRVFGLLQEFEENGADPAVLHAQKPLPSGRPVATLTR